MTIPDVRIIILKSNAEVKRSFLIQDRKSDYLTHITAKFPNGALQQNESISTRSAESNGKNRHSTIPFENRGKGNINAVEALGLDL